MKKTLNEIRVKKKISLSELADALQVSESYCSLMLHGKRRMSLENAGKIAKKFSVRVDDIYVSYNYTKSLNTTTKNDNC